MYKLIEKTIKIYKLSLMCNSSNRSIGTIQFTRSNNNVGYLTNMKITEQFRGLGYGAILIKDAEEILIKKHNVNTIKLSAWENIYTNGNLVGFYENNGYTITDNKHISHYDNGYDIFSIVPMIKEI